MRGLRLEPTPIFLRLKKLRAKAGGNRIFAGAAGEITSGGASGRRIAGLSTTQSRRVSSRNKAVASICRTAAEFLAL